MKESVGTKHILILGAGMVVKNMVDYFLELCKYEVIILDYNLPAAEGLIKKRPLGKAFLWDAEKKFEELEPHVAWADIVVCMLPWKYDSKVAQTCIKLKKNFLNTNAITGAMKALGDEANKAGVLLMTEAGAEPGIDHMINKKLIDNIKKNGGTVEDLTVLCGGLPAMECNNNPFSYKFSWSPMGVMMYSQEDAIYLKNGKHVKVRGSNLMDAHELVDIDGVGTFEVFPNGVVLDTVEPYELNPEKVSYFRGTLRYIGFCNTWNRFIRLGLCNFKDVIVFKEMTYPELICKMLKARYKKGKTSVKKELMKYWKVPELDDTIKKMEWLGLFDENNKIPLEKGTAADAMLALMVPKLKYAKGESDWLLLCCSVIGLSKEGKRTKYQAILQAKGIPDGENAMCRAVSFSAAVTTRMILEGKVKGTGLMIPVAEAHYEPALEELAKLGLKIDFKETPLA